MKLTLFLLFIAIFVVVAFAHGDDHDHDDDVLVLESSSFDAAVVANDPLLVKFYAPWCGHCKKLAAPFAQAAHELHGIATLAKVDCTEEKSKRVCAKYGVKGFPTLKVFAGLDSLDGPADYAGQRTAASIVTTMKKAAKPAYTVVEDKAALDAVLGDKDAKVVAVLYQADGEHDSFKSFASANKASNTFAIVTDSTLAAAVGVSDGGIYLHQSWGEGVAYVPEGDSFDADHFKNFMTEESFPPLGEIGPENYAAYVDRGLPIGWLFVEYRADPEAIVANFEAVAAKHKGVASFVKLDSVKWQKHAVNFGLEKFPSFAIEISKPEKKVYQYTAEDMTDFDSLDAFITDFAEGKLTPFIKSEEIPEKNDGDVFTLVRHEFESVITNREKPVFVKYYAPWCGHCKKLAPTWDELGSQFSSDDVVIADCDATANDIPEDISGFPTLIYYPVGGDAVKYSGGRTLEDLSDFVAEQVGVVPSVGSSSHDEL